MSARIGFVGGVLALTALEAVLSSQGATGRVTGAFSGLSSLLQRIADPTVPAIPDLRPAAAQTSTTAHQQQPPATGRRHLTTA